MEQKITLEAVGDLDKYKQTLALTKANIMLGAMPMDERFTACCNALPACGKLDVDRRVEAEIYRSVMMQKCGCRPVTKEGRQSNMRFAIKFVLGFLLSMLAIGALVPMMFLSSKPKDSKPQDIPYKSASYIWRVIFDVEDIIYDVDSDGEINCCDYALLFKCVWDIRYNTNSCRIVWNVNHNTGMNHLFVKVYFRGRWLYVEPRADEYDSSYLMEDMWGSKYVPSYNRENQTELWLQTMSDDSYTRQLAYRELGVRVE